jgi:dTDP-glucose 4,6-dehydratase/UDP-glucose 4-epimerase
VNIIIIGSNGFIGANAVRYFLSLEYNVWGCDITDNLHQEINFQRIGSATKDFLTLFQKRKFEVCINCSGSANVGLSFLKPDKDFELNVVNVFHLLEAIRRTNPECKFINFSSAAVYGNPSKLPIHEEFELNPISPYGHHKIMSEKLCREYSSIYSMHTVNLRIFSAYGEGQKKMLFYDLFRKAQMYGNIELFGTGNESRDFIYIDDLLEAVRVIINNAEFEGENVNVANGEEILIKDAVRLFYGILNPGIKYRFTKKEKLGDPVNWKADINKIKSYGFSPKYNLSDGLEKYIRWAKLLNYL